MVTVSLPHALHARAGYRRQVVVTGQTIREIIRALDHDIPGMHFHLCYETGELRPFVNIFVNGEHIRYLQGLDTLVPTEANIAILQSVAGG